jgi:signal transduction histidine kinase
VTAEAGHAVYRAVQESLTNAARYAPGAAVRVRMQWGPDLLRVEVEDDGAAPGHQPLVGQGGGLGLAGMRERLAAVGGSVEAGPRGPQGPPGPPGWRVVVGVPAGAAREERS